MIRNTQDLIDIVNKIDPALCSYQEWINVGMVLKDAGAPVSCWDSWSAKDPERYHFGECPKKWDSFRGSGQPVTEASVVELAKKQGVYQSNNIESYS